MSSSGDACPEMNIVADVAFSGEKWRACVKPDPDANCAVRGELLGELHGRAQRSGGGRESEEERVSLSVYLGAVVTPTGFADDAPVLGEGLGVPTRAELHEKLRRSLNVREEERDGAGRELAQHATIIRRARRLGKLRAKTAPRPGPTAITTARG